MNRFLLFVCLIGSLLACDAEVKDTMNHERFKQELSELKEFYAIPGMSAIISKDNEIIYEEYFGYADLDKQVKVDSSTAFPIASITKLYATALIMKLVENGDLSLEDSIKKYLPATPLNDSIQIKHLLSHTSQGKIGVQFFYSARFSLLTQVLEKASGKSFKQLMNEEILQPAQLSQTFLLKDSAQLAQKKITVATPYVLDEGIQQGFIDYGYSTSAGIVSTARDLNRFSNALDRNQLITQQTRSKLYQGLGNELPYAYGLFRQEIEGVEVLWVYGQYDCYASLLVKVPSKNLSLTLLGNNNLMSDPARLIMGDAMSSLFVISFLKNYVFDLPDMKLMEHPDSVYTEITTDFYRKKVLAQALGTAFMARFDSSKLKESAQLLDKTFQQYPDYLAYGDINLLHNLCFLKDVAFYRDLGEFKQFDEQLVSIGQKLLA